MSLSLYDKALLNKLKDVFENVVDASDEKALQLSEDDNAMVYLPLISFWRLNNNLSTEYAQSPLKNLGRRGTHMIGDSKLVNYELAFNLEYQIDIWSDRRSECDDLFTELVLFLLQDPNLILYDANAQQEYVLPISITETVTNVDLTQFSDKGNLYRQVITITVPNAPVLFPKKHKIIKTRLVKWVLENFRGDRFDL